MGLRGLIPIAAAVAMLAAGSTGCNGSGGSSGDAADLTKWLPPVDGASYTAVDLAAYKEDLGLPEDRNPWDDRELGPLSGQVLSVLLPPARHLDDSIIRAIDPGAITVAAKRQTRGSGKGYANLAAFATAADTGEVGSALGDLGYRDVDGILVRGQDDPAIRLDDGLIFASNDVAALRSVPDEQADDVPLDILGRAPGDAIIASGAGPDCVRESATVTTADGAASIAFLVDGDADGDRVQPQSAIINDPDVHGNFVEAQVQGGGPTTGPALIQAKLLPSYDCG